MAAITHPAMGRTIPNVVNITMAAIHFPTSSAVREMGFERVHASVPRSRSTMNRLALKTIAKKKTHCGHLNSTFVVESNEIVGGIGVPALRADISANRAL